MSAQVVLKYPETFRLKCDVHPWELAFCHVMEHPFFAVSDVRGQVAFRGVPAGQYELAFWHEKLGVQKRTVTIKEGQTTRVEDVIFKPPTRRRRKTS